MFLKSLPSSMFLGFPDYQWSASSDKPYLFFLIKNGWKQNKEKHPIISIDEKGKLGVKMLVS